MTTISLRGVKEGMHVHDVNDQHVGRVRFVKMGDENPAEPGVNSVTVSDAERINNESLVEEVAETIVPDASDDLPIEIRDRLILEGYVRIDTGMLRSDRFVTPSQISQVSEDTVMLNITKDTLMAPLEPAD